MDLPCEIREYDKNIDIRFILSSSGQNFTSEVRNIKYNKNILNCSLWTKEMYGPSQA